MAQMLQSISLPGSAIYGCSVFMAAYALGTRDWSSFSGTGVTVDGYTTTATFNLGLFDMRGLVTQENQLQFKADGYQWCNNADPGPIFDMHQQALCGFLMGARASGLTSILIGVVAVTLCLLLSFDTLKKRHRRGISTATAVLASLQFFFTLACFVLWCCMFKVMNADLKAQYPGAGIKLALGSGWAMMFLSTLLCFGAAVGIALHTRGEVQVKRGPIEMGPRPDLEAAKQHTSWWMGAGQQQADEEIKSEQVLAQ